MNSKNLSKAINRMLAFLLSVAMIATSSFVTPALADVVDGEEIEVVNEIGSEDTSDTVMTTDDSTDDIIVENIEEGGEELSDAQAEGSVGSTDLTKYIHLPSDKEIEALSKAYDGDAINATTAITSKIWIQDPDDTDNKISANEATEAIEYYYNKDESKLWDASSVISSFSESSSIKNAGYYGVKVSVTNEDATNTDKYTGEAQFKFQITRKDLSSIPAKYFSVTEWKANADRIDTDMTVPNGGATIVYTSSKGADNAWSYGSVSAGNVSKITLDNTQISADEAGGEKPEITTAIKALGLAFKADNSDSDVITIDNDNFIITKVEGDNVNATPSDTEDEDKPSVHLKVDTTNFYGDFDIPFSIAKKVVPHTNTGSLKTVGNTTFEVPVTTNENGAVTGTICLDGFVLDETENAYAKVIGATVDTTTSEGHSTGYASFVADYFDVITKDGKAYLQYKIKPLAAFPDSSNNNLVISLELQNYDIQNTTSGDKVPVTLTASFVNTADVAKDVSVAVTGNSFTYGKDVKFDFTVTNPAASEEMTNFDDSSVDGVFYKLVDDKNDVWEKLETQPTDANSETGFAGSSSKIATHTYKIDAATTKLPAGNYKVVFTYKGKVKPAGVAAVDVVKELAAHMFEVVGDDKVSLYITANSEGISKKYQPNVSIDASDIKVEDAEASGTELVLANKDYSVTPKNNDGIFSRSDFYTKNKAALDADTTFTSNLYEKGTDNKALKGYYYTAADAGTEVPIYAGEPYAVIRGNGNWKDSSAIVVYDIEKGTTKPTDISKTIVAGGNKTYTVDLSKGWMVTAADGTDNITDPSLPATAADKHFYEIPDSFTYTIGGSTIFVDEENISYDKTTKKLTVVTNANATTGNTTIKLTPDEAYQKLYKESTASGGTLDLTVTLTISKRVGIETDNKGVYTYNGEAVTPAIVVKKDGTAVTASGNYTGGVASYWQLASEVYGTLDDAKTAMKKAGEDGVTTKTTFYFGKDGKLYTNKIKDTTKNVPTASSTSIGTQNVGNYLATYTDVSTDTGLSGYYVDPEDKGLEETFEIKPLTLTSKNITWVAWTTTEADKEYGSSYVAGKLADPSALVTNADTTKLATNNNGGFGVGPVSTTPDTTNLLLASAKLADKANSDGSYDVIVSVKLNDAKEYTKNPGNVILNSPLTKTYEKAVTPLDVNKKRGGTNVLGNKPGEIVIYKSVYTYTGKDVKPQVKALQLYKADTTPADTVADTPINFKDIPDNMYTVTYKNAKDVYTDVAFAAENPPTVTVKFSGYYKGEISANYTIGKASSKDMEFKPIEDSIYTDKTTATTNVYTLPDTITDKNNVTYNVLQWKTISKVTDGSKIFAIDPTTIESNTISCSLKKGEVIDDGASATITATAELKNYEDVTVDIKLSVASVENLAIIAAPTITGLTFDNEQIELSDYGINVATDITNASGTAITDIPENQVVYSFQEYDTSKNTWSAATRVAPKNAGSYRVVITLASNKYIADPVTVPFTIGKYELSNTNSGTGSGQVSFDLNPDSYVYNGEDLEFTGIVKVHFASGDVTLVKGVDYDLEATTVTDVKTLGKKVGVAAVKTSVNYTAPTTPDLVDDLTITKRGTSIDLTKDQVVSDTDIRTITTLAGLAEFLGAELSNPATGEKLDLATIKLNATFTNDGRTGTVALEDGSTAFSNFTTPFGVGVLANTADDFVIEINYDSTAQKVVQADKTKALLNANYTAEAGASRRIRIAAEEGSVVDPLETSEYVVEFIKDGAVEQVAFPKAGETVEMPILYDVVGWYKDEALTKQWNFTKDVVNKENAPLGTMRLYARVVEAPNTDDETTDEILAEAGIEVESIPAQTYTGKDIKPNVVLRQNGRLLKAKTDYTVNYTVKRNAAVNPSIGKNANVDLTGVKYVADSASYSVTVTMKIDNEAGTLKGLTFPVYYDIKPIDLAVADIAITTAGQGVKTSVKPLTQVKAGKIKLNPNVDYTYNVLNDDYTKVYSDLKDVKTARTFTANKNYIIEIVPTENGNYACSSDTGTIYDYSFSISDKAHLVKNLKVKLSDSTVYASMDTVTGQMTPNYVGLTITAGTEYTVRSNVGNTTIVDRSGKNLFDIGYINADRTGKASVVISACPGSGYFGSKVLTYKINGTKLSANSIPSNVKKAIAANKNGIVFDGHGWTFDQVYNSSMNLSGAAAITMEDLANTANGVTKQMGIVYGRDYYIEYKNNVSAGTGKMIFTAKPTSIYTGSFTINFKINKLALEDALREVEGVSVAYHNDELLADMGRYYNYSGPVLVNLKTRKGSIPTGTTLFINAQTNQPLVEGTDYTLNYGSRNKLSGNIANCYVEVKGKGNYAGGQTVKVYFNPYGE